MDKYIDVEKSKEVENSLSIEAKVVCATFTDFIPNAEEKHMEKINENILNIYSPCGSVKDKLNSRSLYKKTKDALDELKDNKIINSYSEEEGKSDFGDYVKFILSPLKE